VFLIPTLDVGGAERVVVRTATALDRARFIPSVVAVARNSGNLDTHLKAAGIPTAVLDEGARPSARQVWRLYRWLTTHPADVLVTYMFHANIAGRMMRRLGAVPAVISSERAAGLDANWRVVVDRLTAAWADAITVNSIDGRRFWAEELRIPESRLSLLYNGLDTASYSPGVSATARRIGALARLEPPNGHDWLIDALALLDRLVPEPWTCAFAGAGSEEPTLRAKVTARGLTRRIEFVGHLADPVEFLRSLMIFVHPSRFAGMPNAVLEAMACGLPVVATAVGGTPEAVEHGGTGWLVKPGDWEGTASLLADLLRDSNLRDTTRIAARAKIVQEFSLQRMVAATEALLEQVADGSRRH
jgi:glycosyltransferase involved in cell wall biosynthesis